MGAKLSKYVDGFKPVSLPELERRAALQMRVDRKYVVDHETLEQLFAQIGDDYLVLEIDGERLQQYDSVYFDTPSLGGYKDHLQGRRKRFKSRTRLYGGTACFFDLKLKGRRGETVKSRLSLSASDHGSLSTDASAFLKRGLLEQYGHRAPGRLVPTLVTSFRRLTLVHARRQERMTIDFGISLGRAGSGERYRMRTDHVLIETKSATKLGTVDRLLPRLGARPVTSCSKYCLGVALAHPTLPTNPYRPLLRRYFEPAPRPASLPALKPSRVLAPAMAAA